MPNLFLQDDKLLIDDTNDALAVAVGCCCCISDCDGCCTGHTVPTDIVVDLGSPGLTPGSVCDAGEDFDCTDITGEFTLTENGGDSCLFEFIFDEATDFCGVTGIPNFNGTIEFVLTRIFTSGSCRTCFWRLELELGGAETTMATYESEHKGFVENDCTLASAVTLTEVSSGWGSLCDGDMPSTITIEAAP